MFSDLSKVDDRGSRGFDIMISNMNGFKRAQKAAQYLKLMKNSFELIKEYRVAKDYTSIKEDLFMWRVYRYRWLVIMRFIKSI